MKKKIMVVNGPNLNLLGNRQPEIYGNTGLDEIISGLRSQFDGVEIESCQSNCEGDIIDCIQKCGFDEEYCGIILNAGAYTHTSLAIADAIAAVNNPVIEVHISNIFAREEIRHKSLIAPVCAGSISGFGVDSYRLAVYALLNLKK